MGRWIRHQGRRWAPRKRRNWAYSPALAQHMIPECLLPIDLEGLCHFYHGLGNVACSFRERVSYVLNTAELQL
jgi:hypothetical protein